ncbi:MAG TPA: HEAT repeat domain-containing protein [Bryobacteraceae bacterium]|jgi:HEAT repeat protein|nr:HEAT repeat domain-containing protein [Bryobacteraceae bacterium]
MHRPLGFLLALAALPSFATVTDQQCTDLLKHALSASNPDTRKMAVAALSLAASNAALFDQLQAMLHDKDVEVRLAVIAGLQELKTRHAIEALKQALKDPAPEVSFAAAKSLWTLNDPAGKQALLSVLAGESRTSSGFFSKEMRDAMRMMHTPRTTFIYAARQGVGFAPVPGLGMGISSMQQILMDPGVSGRAAAALLLERDKDPATTAALENALFDKDWRVRAAAVHSLAMRNDPRLRPEIEPIIEDDKEEVRLRAAAALLRLSAVQAKFKARAAAARKE